MDMSLILTLLTAAVFATDVMPVSDEGDLGDRAAFERTLEAKIDAALDAMLGPDAARSFVRASVEEIPESGGRSLSNDSSDEAALWDEIRGKLDDLPPVLPGYRIPRSLKAEVLSRVAQAAAPRRVESRKRTVLTVSLLVDESVEAKSLTPATAALAHAVGLDPDRGDILQITRTRLRPTWVSLIRGERFRGFALAAFSVALGASLPLLAAWLLWKPGKRTEPEKKVCSQPLEAPPLDADFNPIPFWNDARYARAVADFLAHEPPEAAAAVLSLLTYDAAGDVFRLLPEAARRGVAALLAAESGVGAKDLFHTGQLRRRLREHLASYARGPGLLEELLLRAPQPLRDGLLGDLQRVDPDAARRIRRAVPSFRDLARADENSLRLCLSVLSTADLVRALYDFDPAPREKMLESLPILLREEIREQLRSFVPDSMESVETARSRITARWRRLERDGRVSSLLSASADSA